MSSSAGGIGSTLTGGIQDIAAILPLLGTEQCSVQVGSALTRGYLYAASAPMSIFGSLGVVSAGFKTLVACFSFRNIEGAKILGNMGFEPQGENLSLIMVEAGKGKNSWRYVVETRMDEMIKELNIDKNRIIGVSHKSAAWNVKMMATTALLCAFSIAPYIFLNRGANKLDKSATWVFPVLRATGGFITATLIQLLIQRRITTLSDQYLANRDQLPQQRNTDVEAAFDTKKYVIARRITPTWLLLCLLLIGLVSSVVGYVGCFSVVQNSTSTIGPVSWLCLEAGLSIIRLAIWAWNPSTDDAPPLEIILELDKYNPLPTCNKDNEEILQSKVLPLTRARDFLKIITSFAGLIEPFTNPDLSLYYTLTRKRPSKMNTPADMDTEPENADKHKLGERTLYITVFDHKERTTRVYTRDDERDIFYSTKSDAPLVDVGHFLLEVEIDAEINPRGDPVSSVTNNMDSLHKHHRSILEHIQYRLEDGDVTKPYAIENSWTMKVENTISTVQRLRDDNGDDWKTAVQKGKAEERNEESLPICDYLMHSSIERERQLLYEKRVKWIARRMEMITKETKERLQGEMGVEYRVNKQAVEKTPAIKSQEEIEVLLCSEQYLMELLLLYEVEEWEQLFWNRLKAFLDQISNDRVEEKERVRREWRADCWKRLKPQMHAAEKRLADLVTGKDKEIIGKRWASSINRLFEGVEKTNSVSLSELRGEMESLDDEIRRRIENEIEDTEFRLKRGSDLGLFDQFWDDDTLFKCRYSRSKWLYLKPHSTVPLEIYSHALKGNKNIIHIAFGGSDSDVNWFRATIRDLPWVTSISCDSYGVLDSRGRRDPLFIKSTNKGSIKLAEEIRFKLLFRVSTYSIFTEAEYLDMHTGNLENSASILISFVAPTSGQRLTLRLKHSGKEDTPLEVSLGSAIIQLNPSSKSSLTVDDITLYPIPGHGHLSFEPGIRNDIVIQLIGTKNHGHRLHDIELLDEAGLEEYGDIWKTVQVVENRKDSEEERNEESSLTRDYFMLLSIERERRLLDEKRVKWIARRMDVIIKETKERFQGEMGVEYRVKKQAVGKIPTKSPEEIEQMLCWEQYLMRLLLVYEVNEWEQLFWDKLKAFLDQIGNDLVEVKERLTREWWANYRKKLNPLMHAAEKSSADLVNDKDKKILGEWWASFISQLVEGVGKPNSISLSELRGEMESLDDEIRRRIENEIEDTEFRLKRGSDLGRFDQFWDDDTLFKCRYSRSKWLSLKPNSTVPLEIYSHALKGNKKIIHITFGGSDSDVNWFRATIRDLPWVTSITCDSNGVLDNCDRRDLFIKSRNKGLTAEEIRFKLNPFQVSTYIFTDAEYLDMHTGNLENNASILISFVAPTFGQKLILRLKHSGKEDGPLEVTLGSTIIQLNPSSKLSLTTDDITLYPIPGPSEFDHLSFEPGIRNDIVIQFRGTVEKHGHRLHDIELLDEAGLEEYGDIWKTVVENGKEEERNEESLLARDYFKLLSIERERRLLDEKRVKWISRRMEMIAEETKERFQGEMGVEYRINRLEVKKLATKSPEEIEQLLCWEQYLMELLLLYEVNEWEELLWNKFKVFLDQISNDLVEVKERLTREWKVSCRKRLDPQMHAAEKRWTDLVKDKEIIRKRWASLINQLQVVEGVGKPNSISLSELRREMEPLDDNIRLRVENEIEDTEFRLKRGSDLGRFDQFWDDDFLFECRYSRSKWLHFDKDFTSTPLEIYLHALKGKKNIIHISFSGCGFDPDSDVNWLQATICDLPWVTSISADSWHLPAIHRDPLFIKSRNKDLIIFAKEIRRKLDLSSTYIFTDAGGYYVMRSGKLANNARVLISFVAPKSGQSLILRLKHSGKEDAPLEVTLGSTEIQLNPSSKSSLTVDDITLYPIPDRGRLSFKPGIRNDVVARFGGNWWRDDHLLHDIELLDEAGREYMPHSASLSILSN